MEGTEDDEKAWKKRFAGICERGEFFRPLPELLLAIMESKVQKLEAEKAELREKWLAERVQRERCEAALATYQRLHSQVKAQLEEAWQKIEALAPPKAGEVRIGNRIA